MKDSESNEYYQGPVWREFGLTYASYAVIPRRALQSMPASWQQAFVELMSEMHQALPSEVLSADWSVTLREKGRFAQDWRADYKYTGPIKRKRKSP